mmetsp:Transcript_15904/g.47849  ORF Transcript_15904/g.47849 Transcript_15904/m.47849 type:complete len:145 (-) Transcript_15904:386-820(-)
MKDTVYHVKETMWCPRHSNCQSCCIFTEGISGEARLELPAPPSGRATVAANSLIVAGLISSEMLERLPLHDALATPLPRGLGLIPLRGGGGGADGVTAESGCTAAADARPPPSPLQGLPDDVRPSVTSDGWRYCRSSQPDVICW